MRSRVPLPSFCLKMTLVNKESDMYQGSGPAVVSKEVVPPAPVLGLMDVDVDQDSASQGQVLPPALAQPLPSLGFMDVDGDSSLPVPQPTASEGSTPTVADDNTPAPDAASTSGVQIMPSTMVVEGREMVDVSTFNRTMQYLGKQAFLDGYNEGRAMSLIGNAAQPPYLDSETPGERFNHPKDFGKRQKECER